MHFEGRIAQTLRIQIAVTVYATVIQATLVGASQGAKCTANGYCASQQAAAFASGRPA